LAAWLRPELLGSKALPDPLATARGSGRGGKGREENGGARRGKKGDTGNRRGREEEGKRRWLVPPT